MKKAKRRIYWAAEDRIDSIYPILVGSEWAGVQKWAQNGLEMG